MCGIVDMELDDALAFIVTELIEGKNLREDVRANGRYVGDDLERLGRKLIEAVKAVHAAGIVHRDIKPTNVMVSNTGPVLVDFGIAMGEGESHVTRTGLVMGTPGFIAPEIIDGAESDEMSDWWSVASVLAFAATGEPVFGTKPMMAVLERAAAGSANLAGLPAGTMAAFRSALDPDRTKRCTPDELLQAIALDALNPQAWISGNTSDAADSARSEAMLPFDGSPDNPRMLWRALDHVTGEDAIGTRTLPQFVEATQAIGATVIADITDTVIADAPDAGTSVMDINAHTATIPLGTGTRVLPVNSGDTSVLPQDTPQSTRVMPVQDAWNPAQEAAQIDPAIKPALQRIANQRPPAVIPNASVEMAQSAQPQDMQTSAVPTAPVTPAAPLNRTCRRVYCNRRIRRRATRRTARQRRAPLRADGDSCGRMRPVLAMDRPDRGRAAGLVARHHWIQYGGAAGTRRPPWGQPQASDWFARAATLPWHVLKGLGYAVPRALIMAVIAALGLTIATVTLQLPFAMLIRRYSDSRFRCRPGLKGRFRKAASPRPVAAPSAGWYAPRSGSIGAAIGCRRIARRPKSGTTAESYDM